MKPKNLAWDIFIVVLIIIFAGGVVACSHVSAFASNKPNPEADIKQVTETAVQSEINTPPAVTKENGIDYLKLEPNISTTKKDLTAVLEEISLDPQNPTVKVCSDLPTIADWLPIFSVNLNDQAVRVMQISVLNSDKTRLEINRCYMVLLSPESFNFNNISGTLVVSMDYFKILMPEKLPSDSEIVAAAKTEAQKQGIDFEVQDLEHGWNINVTKKPTDMNADQAIQIVTKILETQAGRVDGPWVFTIDLDKQ